MGSVWDCCHKSVQRSASVGERRWNRHDFALAFHCDATRVHMTVETFSGGDVGDVLEEESDVVTEEFVVQRPQRFMPPAETLKARKATWWQATRAAEKTGMPLECVIRLRNLVTKVLAGAS